MKRKIKHRSILNSHLVVFWTFTKISWFLPIEVNLRDFCFVLGSDTFAFWHMVWFHFWHMVWFHFSFVMRFWKRSFLKNMSFWKRLIFKAWWFLKHIFENVPFWKRLGFENTKNNVFLKNKTSRNLWDVTHFFSELHSQHVIDQFPTSGSRFFLFFGTTVVF